MNCIARYSYGFGLIRQGASTKKLFSLLALVMLWILALGYYWLGRRGWGEEFGVRSSVNPVEREKSVTKILFFRSFWIGSCIGILKIFIGSTFKCQNLIYNIKRVRICHLTLFGLFHTACGCCLFLRTGMGEGGG